MVPGWSWNQNSELFLLMISSHLAAALYQWTIVTLRLAIFLTGTTEFENMLAPIFTAQNRDTAALQFSPGRRYHYSSFRLVEGCRQAI